MLLILIRLLIVNVYLLYIQDAYPVGEISLGPARDGFEVTETVPDHLPNQPCTFMLKVPYRSKGGFPLLAEAIEEKKDWMAALRTIIEGPESKIIPETDKGPTCYEEEKEYSMSFTSNGSE